MISCRLSSSSTGQALSHVSRGLFCRAGVREVGTKTACADVLVDISRVLGGSSHPLRPTGTATHGETLWFPAGFAASHFSLATPCGAWLATFEVALSSWPSVTCKSCFRATCWLLPIHWQTTYEGKCSSDSVCRLARRFCHSFGQRFLHSC